MSTEVSAHVSRSGRAYDLARAALDLDRRAWLVCWGRLGRMPEQGPAGFGPAMALDIINAASLTGFFPTGPIDFSPDHVDVEAFEDCLRVVTRTTWHGEPYLECQMGFAANGQVGMALTRSGRFVDHLIGSSSVLLTDLETLIVDTMILLDAAATYHDLRGPCHVVADVLCALPGEPLRLCTLDSLSGGRPSPGRPVGDFRPVVLDYRDDLDSGAGHAVVWQAFLAAAAQFGAAEPQYLPSPEWGTPWEASRTGRNAPVLRGDRAGAAG